MIKLKKKKRFSLVECKIKTMNYLQMLFFLKNPSISKAQEKKRRWMSKQHMQINKMEIDMIHTDM
jgi:hypothetical protein